MLIHNYAYPKQQPKPKRIIRVFSSYEDFRAWIDGPKPKAPKL